MMLCGCKVTGDGLEKLEQGQDEETAKKVITEGMNMVWEGSKLFDGGMAKFSPKWARPTVPRFLGCRCRSIVARREHTTLPVRTLPKRVCQAIAKSRL